MEKADHFLIYKFWDGFKVGLDQVGWKTNHSHKQEEKL